MCIIPVTKNVFDRLMRLCLVWISVAIVEYCPRGRNPNVGLTSINVDEIVPAKPLSLCFPKEIRWISPIDDYAIIHYKDYAKRGDNWTTSECFAK